MFDLFRKRGASSEVPSSKTEPPDSSTHPFRQSRQGAMVQAEELMHDEVAAAEFIIYCEFADARLKAAENIHSRPQVERVLQAVRNSDRRVAKLMQSRLDICKQWEADEQEVRKCLQEARLLAGAPRLLPSQVASLDKTWQQIRHVAPPLKEDFDGVRASLHARLTEQADLQRAVIDALARLRALTLTPESTQDLAELEQEVARHAAAAEAASLPRNLLIEFEESAAGIRRKLEALSRHQQALTVREEALASWENAEAAALRPEALQREWQALPTLNDETLLAPLQERLQALLRRIAAERQAQAASAERGRKDLQEQYAGILHALEKALEEGALHAAIEHERQLRTIDAPVSAKQTERLQHARAELHRLQGWARWGGQISREELLHAAQALPGQNLPVTELAKKVGSLRERWKSLDASAGPARKELWQEFDAACTAAYAPAAAHFRQLASEREQNAQKARSLIDEIRQFVAVHHIAETDTAAVDWKSVAQFSERMQHQWHHLGVMARQERKKLDADFDAAMQPLSGRLAQQREHEVHQREKLIAEAVDLQPQERNALDKLRALQERWQQRAKALPLARKQEQELWQRFRQACDTVFAKRKEASQAADADRRQHLTQKEALCVRLEEAQSGPAETIGALLREARAAWESVGLVPRAAEQQIDGRYRRAVRKLQDKLDALQRQKAHETIDALHRKLTLCQQLERQVMSLDARQVEHAQAEWRTVPTLASILEKSLAGRLEAVTAVIKDGAQAYQAILETNQAVLQRELLRLEIALGLDSPPGLMRERLQLQVEVLQSSFKTGYKTAQQGNRLELLDELCRLPALVDQHAQERIGRIISHLRQA